MFSISLDPVPTIQTTPQATPTTKPKYVFKFTPGVYVSLVLAGIAAFNILSVIFAALFLLCTRSKRAFEMKVWDFYLRQKRRNSDEGELFPNNYALTAITQPLRRQPHAPRNKRFLALVEQWDGDGEAGTSNGKAENGEKQPDLN